MAGLRERKKQERKERICDAAFKLFNARGYNAVTMDEVASKADLGVGTLYNYFPSKGDLLLAIMTQRLEEQISNTPPLQPEAEADATAAIAQYLEHYLGFFRSFDRTVWVEMFKAMLSNQSHVRQGLSLDMKLVNELTQLIMRLQAQGLIRRDTDPGSAAMLVYSTFITVFMGSLLIPGPQGEQFLSMIGPNIQLIYNGLRPGGQ